MGGNSSLNNNVIDNKIVYLSKRGPNKEFQKFLIKSCFTDGDTELLNNILNLKYFDFNLVYDNYNTLLCYAIETDNLEIIRTLLSNPKVDVNQLSIHFYNF